jgi:two-component system response regulator CpxR
MSSQTSETPGSASTRLLVIDDDADICALVAEHLSPLGFQVVSEHNGLQGLERARSGDFALILLDVMMPGLNGLDVLRALGEHRVSTPVLMISDRGGEMDRVLGLELGADDYLPKPFSLRELEARIRAILRRARSAPAPGLEILYVGSIELNVGARTVRSHGQSADFTAVEFDLLAHLMRSAGQVVRREELAREVLERELMAFDRSLDVHISKVRRKLSTLLGRAAPIETVRGVGFVYTLPGAAS